MRNVVVLVLVAAFTIAAAPAKKKTAPPKPTLAAPAEVPHAFAMFLGTLSNGGTRPVTFRARALGVRFFFEEPSGTTVYRFEKGKYVREGFLRNVRLDGAVKKYGGK